MTPRYEPEVYRIVLMERRDAVGGWGGAWNTDESTPFYVLDAVTTPATFSSFS